MNAASLAAISAFLAAIRAAGSIGICRDKGKSEISIQKKEERGRRLTPDSLRKERKERSALSAQRKEEGFLYLRFLELVRVLALISAFVRSLDGVHRSGSGRRRGEGWWKGRGRNEISTFVLPFLRLRLRLEVILSIFSSTPAAQLSYRRVSCLYKSRARVQARWGGSESAIRETELDDSVLLFLAISPFLGDSSF